MGVMSMARPPLLFPPGYQGESHGRDARDTSLGSKLPEHKAPLRGALQSMGRMPMPRDWIPAFAGRTQIHVRIAGILTYSAAG